jgi:hypothetical protein
MLGITIPNIKPVFPKLPIFLGPLPEGLGGPHNDFSSFCLTVAKHCGTDAKDENDETSVNF